MADCATNYSFGECTYGACLLCPWLPAGLGNAINWVTNAREKGYTISMAPKLGAVAVYGPCCSDPDVYLYSSDGHCGVVITVQSAGSFTVREMNFYGDGGGFDTFDDRVSSLEAVLGFIYPPGSYSSPSPSPPPSTPAQTAGKTVPAHGSDFLPVALLLLGGAAAVGLELHQHPQARHKVGQVSKVQAQRVAGGVKKGEQSVVKWLQSF